MFHMFVDRISTWQWDMRIKITASGTLTSAVDPLDLVKLLLIIFVVTVPIILNTLNRGEVLRIEEKMQLKPLYVMANIWFSRALPLHSP